MYQSTPNAVYCAIPAFDWSGFVFKTLSLLSDTTYPSSPYLQSCTIHSVPPPPPPPTTLTQLTILLSTGSLSMYLAARLATFSPCKVLLRAVRAARYGSQASHKFTVIPMYIEITCTKYHMRVNSRRWNATPSVCPASLDLQSPSCRTLLQRNTP